MTKQGTFYGIGVGPGDPELLTVKAIHAIGAADVIIAPKTEKKDGSVALSIARPYLKNDVEIVYQVFPMVSDFAQDPTAWDNNAHEIIEILKQGRNVAFLTLGDAMFYSTYIYLFERLSKEDIDIVTVPGVPACAAIGSLIGKPIVEGNEVLSIVPATADTDTIDKALSAADNIVLMKVYKNFSEIVDLLEKHDMADEAVLVSRAGLDDERIISDLPAHQQ